MSGINERRLDLGNAPFDLKYQRDLNKVASQLDAHFNTVAGPRRWGVKGGRKVGFVLLAFPFGGDPSKYTLAANGANNDELIRLFRHLLTKLEAT